MEQHEDFKDGANPEADIGGDTVGVSDMTNCQPVWLMTVSWEQLKISQKKWPVQRLISKDDWLMYLLCHCLSKQMVFNWYRRQYASAYLFRRVANETATWWGIANREVANIQSVTFEIPENLSQKQIKPKFRLVQTVKGATNCRLSLVLDISGSMKKNQKLAKMNKALQKLILYTLPEGAEVAISTFSSRGRVSQSLSLPSTSAREEGSVSRLVTALSLPSAQKKWMSIN